MKKFIGVIGGVLILISVFLPSITVGPISVSLWQGAPSKGAVLVFMAFGAIVAACSYLGRKWSKIVAVIFAILALVIDFIWISDASGQGASTGIGLWIAAIGGIMGIVGAFIKDKKVAS
ncbi:hypothetical protein [Kordia sp.]|uniref:hypothetical protein n=1 Tax=Kordia sp. TaxID=1965332 RepID=UPI0025BB6BB0|nr:hypothetical protein [Kordia sp.]MCH2193620.1 hypothetical protein [Kordia sp.]